VALALPLGLPETDDGLAFSPGAHPATIGMIERRMPVTIAVRHNGLRAVAVTLVRSKQFCCVVISFMCCSDLVMAYFLRNAGHKIDMIEG
jgi:hypothetical protein